MVQFQRVFADLGLTLIERGWLSSNSIMFPAFGDVPAAIIDTGYVSQSQQTVELVRKVVGDVPLLRIVNTHLHSDHCGGNANLARHFSVETLVPKVSYEAARRWDEEALCYSETGQRCDRFTVDGGICPGGTLQFGAATWRVVAAPGHDPHAVMLFEPRARVLISADALWEDRLAIVFPEIDGLPGFFEARAVLGLIESLEPAIVIPGHGPAFADVSRALRCSRDRLSQFEQKPERHVRYAIRALTMFHMLEVRHATHEDLVLWLQLTPIFGKLHALMGAKRQSLAEFSADTVEQLMSDGLLERSDGQHLMVR
jgi:glyoxylase-like metal-dependent hydrolase (beta-lactamase superfamily II)